MMSPKEKMEKASHQIDYVCCYYCNKQAHKKAICEILNWWTNDKNPSYVPKEVWLCAEHYYDYQHQEGLFQPKERGKDENKNIRGIMKKALSIMPFYNLVGAIIRQQIVDYQLYQDYLNQKKKGVEKYKYKELRNRIIKDGKEAEQWLFGKSNEGLDAFMYSWGLRAKPDYIRKQLKRINLLKEGEEYERRQFRTKHDKMSALPTRDL